MACSMDLGSLVTELGRKGLEPSSGSFISASGPYRSAGTLFQLLLKGRPFLGDVTLFPESKVVLPSPELVKKGSRRKHSFW